MWLTTSRYGWAVLAGAVWFVLMFVGMLWLWRDPAPEVFSSPDEAMNRLAAEQIVKTGVPSVELPFDDPEDVAHLRLLVSTGDDAIPVLPPMTPYLYAGLLALPLVGGYLIMLLAAGGAGAFAASVALLGARRQWVSLLAPVAAFPALYWLLRPWINMSLFLTLVSGAFLCLVLWKHERRLPFLLAMGALLAVAAAVRPDYTAVTFLLALFFVLLEARPNEAPKAVAVLIGSGVLAVLLMFALNAAVSGDPLTFGYEISDQLGLRPGTTPGRQELPTPLAEIYYLFLPNGVPELGQVGTQLWKYWFQMGPIALLTLSLPIALVLLAPQEAGRRLLYGGAIAFAFLFVVSRVDAGFFGAPFAEAQFHHSLPRYWSPVYLLAVVPLCVLAMSARSQAVWLGALLVLAVLAVSGAHLVYLSGGPESMTGLRARLQSSESYVDRLDTFLPDDAMVYSAFLDKALWSRWHVGYIPRNQQGVTTLPELERVRLSLEKAAGAPRPAFLIRKGQLSDEDFLALQASLAERNLTFRPTGPEDLQVYVLGALSPAPDPVAP
ncbi:MAG: hypothetical protein WEE64_12660 [Dehalococcoidia bacterium]